MRQIASEFARAMQLKLDTTGHFFERRFHAVLVEADSYLLELLRYIHLNPVRAGFATDAAKFNWSSHHVYVGARAEPWVTTDFALSLFASDRGRAIAAYRNFVDSPCGDSITPQLETRNLVIGSEKFIAQIQQDLPPRRDDRQLVALIDEACRRFEVDAAMLNSPVRSGHLTRVRAWIAHQAQHRGIATCAAVARALGRTEGALRHSIKKYRGEIE